MGIIPWWAKALVVVALVAAVYGGYRHWRSGVEQVGYDRAVAEYEPKLKKLDSQLAEWQASHKQWQMAHETLQAAVEEQKRRITAIDQAAKDRLAATRQALGAAKDEAARNRIASEALARQIQDLSLPKEDCDALRLVVHTARSGGL